MKLDLATAGLGILRIITNSIEKDHGIENDAIWNHLEPLAKPAMQEIGLGEIESHPALAAGYNLAKVVNESRKKKLMEAMKWEP